MKAKFKSSEVKITPWSNKTQGQWSIKEPVGMKVIHIPTGTVVTCEEHRSQHRNREVALKTLETLLVNRGYDFDATESLKTVWVFETCPCQYETGFRIEAICSTKQKAEAIETKFKKSGQGKYYHSMRIREVEVDSGVMNRYE